ncbi:SNF2 family N-terminal domain-containing protein [Cladochytrium replicatum]|nr:SNF2 family N-terminal domain-containing protein [Cladochytrium replicatum]
MPRKAQRKIEIADDGDFDDQLEEEVQMAEADEDYTEEPPVEEAPKHKKRRGRPPKSALAEQVSTVSDKEDDRMKRYAYLLGQTELFAHFLNRSKMKGDDVLALDQAHSKKTADGISRRRGKTEKQEDEELLQQATAQDSSLNPAIVITESPSYVIGGTMRDYQLQGLTWLISLYDNGLNGILADEMGLGKTLQSISFLGYLKFFRNITGPHLVIVPKSTLQNWMNEFMKWVPDLKAFIFHGTKDERAELAERILLPMDFEVCITSFEMCQRETSHFKKINWQYLVMDEAHRIKNENSNLAQIVRMLNSRNRLLLTGTPLQNNLHELWALLNFLLPDVFSSAEDFDSWFKSSGQDQDTVVQQLQKVLRPFLLRRIKADVEKSLLPKKRINLYVGMSKMQREWYRTMLEKDIAAVNGLVGGSKQNKTRLQNIVMQLRKCCNHPYLFDGAEPGPPYTTDQHIVDNAGMFIDFLTQTSLNRIIQAKFQMSRMLDILEDYCIWRQYPYCRIDGSTAHQDRIQSIDEFNKPGSEKFIFLLTTRAGGLGINLATADIVVMYDNDWNPQVDLQAEDRAHRIGQTKQVYVFRFITEKSIEEKMIDRATQKLRLDQLVIQQGRASAQSKAASKDELVSMIQHGAESIFSSTESTIADEDIEAILSRGEEKTAELDKKYETMGLDDLQNFTLAADGSGSVYQWEGEDFKEKRKEGKVKGANLRWIGPSKRERKANYDIDGYYREALRVGQPKAAGPKAPKPPKTANIFDFQFYPLRFIELTEQEILAHRRSIGYKIPKGENEDWEAEQMRTMEQSKIDRAVPLTEEEQAEREMLKSKGFESWRNQDFKAFIKANEKYGRHNIEAIAQEIESKTAEEVRQYAAVFWKRFKELEDWEKYIGNIEKGEARINRAEEVQKALSFKISQYRYPLQQIKFAYGQNKGKNYSEEEDRFMVIISIIALFVTNSAQLVCLEKYGYGSDEVYEHIREEIRRSNLFRFDWFVKSRTAGEIQRRCNTLIMLIFRELETEEKDDKKRRRSDKYEEPAAAPKSKKSRTSV